MRLLRTIKYQAESELSVGFFLSFNSRRALGPDIGTEVALNSVAGQMQEQFSTGRLRAGPKALLRFNSSLAEPGAEIIHQGVGGGNHDQAQQRRGN